MKETELYKELGVLSNSILTKGAAVQMNLYCDIFILVVNYVDSSDFSKPVSRTAGMCHDELAESNL